MLNQGLSLATGRWIHFAAGDDIVAHEFYSKAIFLAEKYHVPLVSGRSMSFTEDVNECSKEETPIPLSEAGKISREAARLFLFKHGSWFAGNTAIYDRETLSDSGGFNHQLHGLSDLFALVCISVNFGCAYTPEILGYKNKNRPGANTKVFEMRATDAEFCDLITNELTTKAGGTFDDKWLTRIQKRIRFDGLHIRATKKFQGCPIFVQRYFFWAFRIFELLLIFRYKPFDVKASVKRKLSKLLITLFALKV